MEKYQAPHEKLNEEEIKLEIEKLLSNHFKFRNRRESSDWEINDFDQFMKNQEESIFKLRHHFSPEKTSIMKITLGELTNMMKEYYEP